MKQILTFTLLLATLTSTAQPGIKAGVNVSYFAGRDPVLAGPKHSIAGFIGGVYDRFTISRRWSLTPELLYVHQGAKNAGEDNVHFDTYSLGLYLPVGYHIGNLEIHLAPYIDKLLYARNSSKEDANGTILGWTTERWRYFNKADLGAVMGLKYDLVGGYLDLSFKYGFGTVKGSEMIDSRYNGCHVAGAALTFCVPFKTFGE